MSKLLIQEPPLQVLPSLAKEIGLNEAIVIQQLHYWLENPKVGFEKDGFKWVSNTYDEWLENFPFWSIATIKRIFAGLEQSSLVVSGQFEKSDWNQRKAYRVNYEQLDSINLIRSKGSNRDALNRNTETTTENIDDSSNSKPAKIVGIESAIFAGRPVTEEDIDPAKTEHDALVAFEASFGVNTEKGQMLAWYGRKPEWTKLRKDVVELYSADPQCFEKYKVWRLTPYVKGAVSLKDVQRDPKCFMASWVAFVETQPKESESKKFEDGSAYV